VITLTPPRGTRAGRRRLGPRNQSPTISTPVSPLRMTRWEAHKMVGGARASPPSQPARSSRKYCCLTSGSSPHYAHSTALGGPWRQLLSQLRADQRTPAHRFADGWLGITLMEGSGHELLPRSLPAATGAPATTRRARATASTPAGCLSPSTLLVIGAHTRRPAGCALSRRSSPPSGRRGRARQ